ncbi:MAG TPA: TolC family protein [Bacteroidia bacterium]|nr:TolC family protein [Bacteroidia bacterium]
MHKRLFLLFLFILTGLWSEAQEKMSLQQAIEFALKNNYSVLIARNQAEISKNDNTAGNAGMLPLVQLAATGNALNNQIHQVYASGLLVDKPGVGSNNITVGPVIYWTLFDGFKMFATRDKLKELQAMGEVNAKAMMENAIAKIIDAYFDIARQKQLLGSLNEAISIYEERLNIADTKNRIGNGSEADVLQAKVDLNEQRSAWLRQKVLIANAKSTLNALLSRDSYTEFDISDSLTISYHPKLEELKTSVIKQNNMLLVAEKNVHVAEYALREVGAQRYPLLSINAGYNYSRSENDAGFVLQNQNNGYTAGFVFSWNLFNGGNVLRQIKDARITALNYELQFKDVRNQIESGLIIAYSNFQNAVEVLNLEEDNIILARKNVCINMERFRLGYVTSLQLKDAEKSFLDAEGRLVTARYDAKTAETELMRLNGVLIK